MTTVLRLPKSKRILEDVLYLLTNNLLYRPGLLFRTIEGTRLPDLLEQGTDRIGVKDDTLRGYDCDPENVIYASTYNELINNTDINALTLIDEYSRPVMAVYNGDKLKPIGRNIYEFIDSNNRLKALQAVVTVGWQFGKR